MFLPDWIYRALPFVCLVLGLIVASRMDSLAGTGSGVLLGITGLVVWKMRVDYRREIAANRERTKQDATTQTAPAERDVALRKFSSVSTAGSSVAPTSSASSPTRPRSDAR